MIDTNVQVQVIYGDTILLSKEGDLRIGEAPWNDFVFPGVDSHKVIEGSMLRPLHGDPIQLEAGQTTRAELGNGVWVVATNDYREKTAIPRDPVDKVFGAYVASVAVVLGSMFALSSMVPDEILSLGTLSTDSEPAYARYFYQADRKIEERVIEEKAPDQPREPGSRARGVEGAAGKPTANRSTSGRMSIRGPANSIPQITRTFDPERAARSAGILGILASQEGHFLASMDGGAFAVGQDDADIWGNLTGTNLGESFGGGALGLVGSGRMGGGGAEGLVGIGNTGLLSKGPVLRLGGTTGFGPKEKRAPTVSSIGKVESTGLDRDVVRRIVRAHINEVRSCYNAGLTNNPHLEGRVTIQFTVLPTGKVSGALVSENTTKEESVANCVAKAVRRWTFPSSKGTSIVTYPFRLSV